MSELNNNLVAAVRFAVNLALISPDDASHLSAQRRIDEDGAETWDVFIGDFFSRDKTAITDTLARDFPSADVEGIASMIEDCWDPAWDEIPNGRGGYVTRSVSEVEAA